MRFVALALFVLCGCGPTATSESALREDGSFAPGVKPDGPMPGEITIWQLALPGGFPLKSGEAAILVGPDGTLVAIDVGGQPHAEQVRAALRELNTKWLTPERGYRRERGALELEWILITHWHADHMRGLMPLFNPADAIELTKGIIHRGFVDVGAGMNTTDFEDVCDALRGPMGRFNFPMCTGPTESPCHVSEDRFPANSCPGLTLGDLSTTVDDAQGIPSYIELGGGARLELLAAGGFALQGRKAVAGPEFGVSEPNEENARSLVGVVRHGPFRFLFAGDLTGSGKKHEPDMESFVVNSEPEVFGDLGMDVIHANHHVRDTSSNLTWVEACAPPDGKTRVVIGGVNAARYDSPQQKAIDAWTAGGRLGAGKLFVTHRGPLGGWGPGAVNVNGRIVVQTIQHGGGYWAQDLAVPSVRRDRWPAANLR